MKKIFIFKLLLALPTIQTGDFAQQIAQGLTSAEFQYNGNGIFITLTGQNKTVYLTINTKKDNCSIKQNDAYRSLPIHKFVLILRACNLTKGQEQLLSFAEQVEQKFSANDKEKYNAILTARNL